MGSNDPLIDLGTQSKWQTQNWSPGPLPFPSILPSCIREPLHVNPQQEPHTNRKNVSAGYLRGHSPPADWVLKLFSILQRYWGRGSWTQWLKSILTGKWLMADSFWRAKLTRARENKGYHQGDMELSWEAAVSWGYRSQTMALPSPPNPAKFCPIRFCLQLITMSHSFYMLVLKSCHGGPNFPNWVFKQYICVQYLGQKLASGLQVAEHV